MPQAAIWEPLSEAQRQRLYAELGATEETLRRDVAAMRQWVALQPHLPQLDGRGVDVDHMLRMYLLRCKNSLERTKEALDELLSSRATIPEFFARRDPTAPDVQGSFDTTLTATMPHLTPDGYRVHYYAYPSADAKGFDVVALFRRVLMQGELALRDDLTRGDVLVVDLANGSAARFRDFTLALSLFTKFIRNGLKMYPVRLKQFHIINLPPFLSSVVNLLGYVMREKLFSRVVVHPAGGNLLQDTLPADCIPQDYGGEGPSLREGNAQWRRYLSAHRDWFLAQEDVKADESKRVRASAACTDDIGCPGSFRTLAVD